MLGGVKIKNDLDGKYIWNTQPHYSRIIHIKEDELQLFANTFENDSDWEGAKLVGVHASPLVSVLKKFSTFNTALDDLNIKTVEGWHETNDVDNGLIARNVFIGDINKYELIYSGPHFYVSNPLYKSSREDAKLNSDYDIVDLNTITESYLGRTNYVPGINAPDFPELIRGFVTGHTEDGKPITDRWIDYYKLGFRKMLSQAGERTLIPAILPRRVVILME